MNSPCAVVPGKPSGRSKRPVWHASALCALKGPTPVIRSDNGLIFQSRRFRAACRDYRLRQEFITSHTPEQNGLVGRFFRSLKEVSGCTTSAASLKLASPLLSGSNGTTTGVLTSHSAIAARFSSVRYTPNSWLDTKGHHNIQEID
jgi:transposase InsO family protein